VKMTCAKLEIDIKYNFNHGGMRDSALIVILMQ